MIAFVLFRLNSILKQSAISEFDYSKSPYKVSLWKTMFKQYWKMMAVAVFYKLLNDTIQFLKPTLLS